MSTIGELIFAALPQLRDAAGDDARLEAEVLLAYALGLDRTHVLARLKDDCSANDAVNFAALLARRISREPLAYIVGQREFYGLDIICTPAALIPRPETEMLVDLVLEEIERRPESRVLDVGTGSGAIAVAVAVNASRTDLMATDASVTALSVARQNAVKHGVSDRIVLQQVDLLAGAGEYDVIAANLPYVSETEWHSLEPEIREHEPRDALVGGETGTEMIARLIEDAPPHLARGGVLAAEIGETQGRELLAAAHQIFPDAQSYVMKDFAGKDRVLVIRREGTEVG